MATARNDVDYPATFLLEDAHSDGKPVELENKKEDEQDDIYYDSSNKSDNAKSCMGSIGSWINDLFTAPAKRSASCPRSIGKPTKAKLLVEEDTEYIKSLNALKEQFKRKLKYETTVTLRNKPLVFNFDKISGNNRKLGKKTRSLSTVESVQYSNHLNELYLEEESLSAKANTEIRRHGGSIFKTQTPARLSLDSSNLVKEKKRNNRKSRFVSEEFEEYVLPTPSELSKRLLLNVNVSDSKCLQVYKNPHIGPQESQHYSARKNKSYQTGARCYTTNANNDSSNSKYFMSLKASRRNFHAKKTDSVNSFGVRIGLTKRNKPFTGKVVEFSTEPALMKAKSPKSFPNAQAEVAKNNPKSSSDELVKLLMKKIKVNYRPTPSKKKSMSLTPVLTTNKNRFMQSATNTLVISVMAKKENENQLKNTAPVSVENKLVKTELEAKPLFSPKDWPRRFIDNNLRKNSIPPKFNKSSYLTEEEKVEGGDSIFYKHPFKSSKRIYGDALKNQLIPNEKQNKRQDVKNMLSKLDSRANAFNVLKAKQKISKKKTKSMLGSFRNSEVRDFLNSRFEKEHDIFNSNPKPDVDDTTDKEVDEMMSKTNDDESSSNPGCLSTELAVIEPNLPLVPEKPKELIDCQPVEAELPQKTAPLDEDPEFNVLDCLHYEEKLSNVKTGPSKNKAYKERLYKTKSLQYIKGESPKSLLGPLTVNNETQQAKDFEPSVTSSVKALGIPLINRRYAGSSLNESNQQKFKSGTLSHMPTKSNFFGSSFKDPDVEKSKLSDKKKERNLKAGYSENSPDKEFGFEKFKKSAPGREKDKFFP